MQKTKDYTYLGYQPSLLGGEYGYQELRFLASGQGVRYVRALIQEYDMAEKGSVHDHEIYGSIDYYFFYVNRRANQLAIIEHMANIEQRHIDQWIKET